MHHRIFASALTAAVMLSWSGATFAAGSLTIPTGKTAPIQLIDGDTGEFSWDSDTAVWDAEAGDRTLFAFPLPAGARFEDYGLCMFEVKVEGGPAEVMVFVERPGERRRVWRAVEIHGQPSGWQRMHIDLSQPEIVRESFFKTDRSRLAFNLWAFDPGYPEIDKRRTVSIRNIRLLKRHLDVVWNGIDCRSPNDPSGDLLYEYPITVRNRDSVVRSVSALVRALESPYNAAVIPSEPDTDRASGRYGEARITPRSAVIAPGDSARFAVTLRLGKRFARALPPFTCEWYLPAFAVKGEPESEECILRSRNLIPLPLIVMPVTLGTPNYAEHNSGTPDVSIAMFGPDGLRLLHERYAGTDWGKKEGDSVIAQSNRILNGDLALPDGPGWAAAYYYCTVHRCPLQYQGPGKHYCPVGKEYLEKDFEGVDLERDIRTAQHETVARNARTLALAYVLTGEERYGRAALRILEHYREKYFTWDWMDLDTARDTIDKGRMEFAKYMETYPLRSMIEALEFLKLTGGVDSAQARRLERELFLPALAEIADYRMDLLCRQTTVTLTALIGGLAYRNAPLTAFAVASPFGYWSLRRWGATSDGICHGHGYAQNHYAKNLVDMAELMDRAGVDTFDSELKRIIDGSFWWSSPMNPAAAADIFTIAARHYPDTVYRKYALRSLLDGEPPSTQGNALDFNTPPSVNFPNSGLTILRRPAEGGGTLDAEFRWGMTDNRGEFAMLSLGLNFYGYRAQNYPGHFPWGSTDLHHLWQIQTASHTTVVVDRRNHSGMKDYLKGHYEPHPSRQLFFDEGPDGAAALAFNDRIAPGVKIWRAVCVLDGVYLVADILRSDREHTYDWWFHGVPDHSNGLAGIQAEMKPRTEPLGTEDGYGMVGKLSSARVNGDLSCYWTVAKEEAREQLGFSLKVLNDAPLEVVHGFEWSYQYRTPEKEFVVLRRERAKNAEYLALIEPHRKESRLTVTRRFTVTSLDGRAAENAVGILLTLLGKRYEVIVNPEGVAVKTAHGGSRKLISILELANE